MKKLLALSLLLYFTNVHSEDINSLVTAINSADIYEVENAIKNKMDVNYRDESGRTLLMLCLLNKNNNDKMDIFNALVNAGADINIQDNNGWTAMMYIAQEGLGRTGTKMVITLISKGAKLDIQNNKGNTALMEAINFKRHAMVRKLVDAGAKPHLLNNDGLDAYELSSILRKESPKNKRLIRISRSVHQANEVKINLTGNNMNSSIFNQIITKALNNRNWVIDKNANNLVEASLVKKDVTYKVNIVRNDDMVSFLWAPGHEHESSGYLQNIRLDFVKFMKIRDSLASKSQ